MRSYRPRVWCECRRCRYSRTLDYLRDGIAFLIIVAVLVGSLFVIAEAVK